MLYVCDILLGQHEHFDIWQVDQLQSWVNPRSSNRLSRRPCFTISDPDGLSRGNCTPRSAPLLDCMLITLTAWLPVQEIVVRLLLMQVIRT